MERTRPNRVSIDATIRETPERAASIFRREQVAHIEREVGHGDVRAEQYVGRHRFLYEIRILTLQSWILMRTEIRERPPIESVLLHVRQVVRWQVVADLVALLNGRLQRVAVSIPVHANRVPLPLAKMSCPLPSGF
jgi:hypothetical protein